jgi:hypothetical protein
LEASDLAAHVVDIGDCDGVVAENPQVCAVRQNRKGLKCQKDGGQLEFIDGHVVFFPLTEQEFVVVDDTPALQGGIS